MRVLRLLIAVPLFVAATFGNTIVVPNAQTSVVGNDDSGSLAFSVSSIEAQDIWSNSQFTSVGGPMLITQIAYRMKPGTGSITGTVTSASLYMSTTSVAPGAITSNLAANRGSDYTLVDSIGSGTIWSSSGCAGPGPCPFDIVFNLTTPFLYDPSKGNLMTDLFGTGFSGTGTGEFDVESYSGPATTQVGEVVVVNGSPTVEYSDNVLQFTYTLAKTPEPSTFFMLLAGIVLLIALRRKTRSPLAQPK